MAEILHRIVIETSPENLYSALTEQNGLSAWWTDAESENEVGGVAQFRFGADGTKVEMQIKEHLPNEKVTWKCVNGPWVDTGEFSFDIKPDKRGSVVKFAHRGWPEADDFYMHCNSKWGFFLGVSLKRYLENGKGLPYPHDPSL